MAPGGRLPGWHPAREFHHGPELKRSIREAEDTDAVDLSLNSKIKYQDAEKNLREKDMGQLRLLDRRSPDTASLVLRTSPPPCRPNLTLAGCRLARATPPAGLPVLRPIPSSIHATAQYPGGTGRCSRRSLPDRWQPSPFQRVVCVKFCKKYFRKIQFSSVDRRRACGNVGKLSVLGEAFPSLRGNPCLLADFL